MAFLQWRRFNFFDKEVIKDPETSQVFDRLKDISVTCSTSGRGQILLGDVEGSLHSLTRQLQVTSFSAYKQSITHVQQMRQHPILVTVGADEPGINPLVKVWNMEKIDSTGRPVCTRIVRTVPGIVPSPVTALAVHENLNLMAVGFHDGHIMLFRGDVTRDRQSKQKLIHVANSSLTGLAFRSVGKHIFLFAVTTDEIFSIDLSVKDKETINSLDNHGCASKCIVMADYKQDNQIIIGRKDALYFYQPDGRGPCLAFEGEKVILHWFRGYLVVVGKDSKPASQSTSVPGISLEMNLVTVYDILNKFIAYSAPIPGVVDVLSEWGTLYVLAQDGKLHHLQEKDTQSKLDMLFKKNQYSLAISLAKIQQYDEEGLVDIFRQYGDHLYSKGDHDGAIAQYIKTIGKLEASYVIRKFLDAQRIHNLTAYLQVLHKKGLATEDHTTLLLNCYTKLKDNNKLDEFIMTKDREVDFDVEIAIKVCRQAGYFTHALYLAEKHNQHDWYLKIQLEDHKDYNKALDYISKLEFAAAEDNMKKYGKILISEVPPQTTELLKRLCTDYRPSNALLIDQSMLDGSPPAQTQKSQPEEFIHIFVNNSDKLLEFLEHMVKVQYNSSNLIYNTLLELYLQAYNHETGEAKKKREQRIMDSLRNSEARYDIDQALVLCQMNNFKPGILHLYEKAKLYQLILSYHMEQKDFVNVIKTCERFGGYDPNLWVQALWYFSQTDGSGKPFLTEVLAQIEKKKLLPPIMIVEIMARSQTATLEVIKDYLVRNLDKESKQIAENERLIKQYREDTEKMRSQIEEIKTSAKIFQVSKCSACNHQLELPSVHFLCGHSYHQQCFECYSAENDTECPLCLPENRNVLCMIRAQEQNKDLHEQFHHQLERVDDGFSVVADYFGRGVFNRVTLVTNPTPRTVPSLNEVHPTLRRDMLLT